MKAMKGHREAVFKADLGCTWDLNAGCKVQWNRNTGLKPGLLGMEQVHGIEGAWDWGFEQPLRDECLLLNTKTL